MRADAPNVFLDGFVTLEGGVDSGRPPDAIRPDQVASAVNATFRGGFATTRPGIRRRTLQFLNSSGTTDATLQAAFEDGLFQRASYFNQFGRGGILVVQIAGRTFRVDVSNDFRVQEITITGQVFVASAFVIPAVAATVTVSVNEVGDLAAGQTVTVVDTTAATASFTVASVGSASVVLTNVTGVNGRTVAEKTVVLRSGTAVLFSDRNSADLPRSWMEQAEDFLVIQDNSSKPLIYNGSILRRSDSEGIDGELIPGTEDRTVKEVPVGNVMAYSNGRLWVALQDGHSFVASDLTGGPTGSLTYSFRDAVLKFSENDIIAEGGSFGVPVTAGSITAMCSIANLDTSLGQGPLQVFTKTAVFSVNAPFDRTQWKNLQYPIQTVSALAYGATSAESTINVNSDIWYRALDGVRSFAVARRDAQTWPTTPLSREMNAVLRDDDLSWLGYASAVVFDNRLLMTSSPYWVADHGVVHRGLAVLDFDRASAILERLPPAWEGLWTGVNILQIVSGDFAGTDRCFAFVLSADNEIQLWELTRDAHFDTSDADSTDRAIVSIYEMRSFVFKDRGWGLKELYTGALWVDQVVGGVTFDLDYKPDQHPCWQDWHSWSENATYKDCSSDPLECSGGPVTYAEQFRPFMRFPEPSPTADAVTDRLYRLGYQFQVRLTITGHAQIKRLMLVAYAKQDEVLPFARP